MKNQALPRDVAGEHGSDPAINGSFAGIGPTQCCCLGVLVMCHTLTATGTTPGCGRRGAPMYSLTVKGYLGGCPGLSSLTRGPKGCPAPL